MNPEWLWTIFLAVAFVFHAIALVEAMEDRRYLVVRDIDSIYKDAAWKMVRTLLLGTLIRLAFLVAGIGFLLEPGYGEWDLYTYIFVATSFFMMANSVLDRKDSISIRAKTRSRARKGE